MTALDLAREEFGLENEEHTAVTVVDRVTSAELLAGRGGRRPEDAKADRITLYPIGSPSSGPSASVPTNIVFWGSSAWSLADLMLVAWADTLRLGRSALVEFEVKFGDGTSYWGEVEITRGMRRGRARLAEQCKKLETFAACFCPTARLPADKEKVSAMLSYFLRTYEIGAPSATTQRARSRKATPKESPIFDAAAARSRSTAPKWASTAG